MKQLLILLLCLSTMILKAQDNLRIALVYDENEVVGLLKEFKQSVKAEINQLLKHQKNITYNEYFGNYELSTIQQNIEKAYTNSDVIITLGIIGSQAIGQQNSFSKPTIAAIVTDPKLNNLEKTAEGTSGISNFTYIESPFDIGRDLQMLYSIQPFDQLAIVFGENMSVSGDNLLRNLINNNLQDRVVNSVFYHVDDLLSGKKELDEETDAVFVLPILTNKAVANTKALFDIINARKLPSSALFGEAYIEYGALMAYENNKNLSLIPRRIALNTMKIVEGTNAGDIPVGIKTYNDNLMINMATARKIGVYPDFDLMATATILGLSDSETERQLTLQSTIAEALKNNLSIQLAALDVDIADTEIGIAQSDQLPQVDVSTSLSAVDNITALSYRGAQGQYNWVGSAKMSQVIFSEPLLANIAIQKLLKKGKEFEKTQTQLDIIIDISEAYLNILQAQANLSIQQKNVEVTKENYNISKSKNELGYSSAADLHRWEAELASKNIELNKAFAGLQQTKFRLNQLLNRPIDEAFSLTKATLADQMLMISDSRTELINNYGQLEKFTSFLVKYSKDKLPTLNILDNNIKVQQRLNLSKERAFYLPAASLSGNVNKLLGKYNIPDGFDPLGNATTWNIGLGINYPIFQGNRRNKELQQSQIQLDQLALRRKDIENQLELRIRSNMENIYVAYSQVTLAREAADAAAKNFDIIQDSYNQGQVNITTLIDAQNNTLQTELNATNAIYSFILDFLNLERSIGFFYFLASEEERSNFYRGLILETSGN